MKFRACELELSGQDDACGDLDEDLDICGLSDEWDPWSPCCDPGTESIVDDGRYRGPFRRVIDRLLAEEARAARAAGDSGGLYDDLMNLSPALREASIHSQDRFISYALAERLLDACREVRREEPDASLELARLALAVADRLDPARYGGGLVCDLKARSWAYLGDLWTESAQPAAGEAFRLALGHLMRGSGDPLDEAEVVALCALATDDFGTSHERLDRAGSIYRSAGDPGRLGEVLARKAKISGEAGDHLRAVGLLREAFDLLRGLAPPLALVELGADLAHHLLHADLADEAWEEISHARRLYARSDRPTAAPALRLRLSWIEGRIAAALGLDDDARSHLEEARDGFLAAGRWHEAVRAHLDLAALSARAPGEAYDRAMDRLASETPRVLAGADLPRESTTVLLLVEQAARRRALRPDLVRAVTGLLETVG